MVAPHFKMLWREDIPIIHHTDAEGLDSTIQLVAGSMGETSALEPTPDSWAAHPDHHVGIYTVKMESGATWTLPKTSSEALRSIFYYKGDSISISGQNIQSDHLIELEAGSDISISNSDAPSYFLILEGLPIGEPVAQHGPFVMNTQEEIKQAMRDYGKTQFGGWPWDEVEVVHERSKGRFALHEDGLEEVKY